MIRIDRIKFRHLHCLVAVAEHGSSVRAAQALCLTQPAVSKTLSELEEIIGQPLFERSAKGITLTGAGRLLVRHAAQGLHTIGEGVEKVAMARLEAAPVISIGALPSAAAILLPKLLLRFQATYPEAHVRVRAGTSVQLIASLRRGELDLVLGRLSGASDMQGLAFEHLYNEPLVFVVRPGHPLRRRKAVAPPILQEYPLLLPDLGSIVRAAADQFFVTAGLGPPDKWMESIDVNFCRPYVLASDVIWCAVMGVVALDLEREVLERLPIDTSMTYGPVGMTMRAEPVTLDAVRALIEMIRAISADPFPLAPSEAAVDSARSSARRATPN